MRSTNEGGFTLVEVIVAVVVFGLVSTGILASASTVIRMTADNSARIVATNLAEQQLDTDRGILDPFQIHNIPATVGGTPLIQTVGGHTYTVTQTTSLVSVDGSDITCGSAKSIYYRRITVQVDWSGRLPTTAPVESDTIIAPNGRINDSSTGSIAVMVTGATGTGESGVAVTVSPISTTAMALSSQPAPTDVDGCAYALGVTPGTYSVSISRPNSVDPLQNASPSNASVTVTAGATTPVTFTYDQSATYPLSYANGASATLPSAMATTVLSSGQPYSTSSSKPAPSSLALYPYPSGYSVIAGKEADVNTKSLCAAEDPAAWSAVPGVQAATRGSAPGTQPGGTSSSVTVPMGVFAVKPLLPVYITAVGQSVTANGQPGCTNPETFTFSQLVPAGSTATLALPYGTYQLYAGLVAGAQTTPIGSPYVTIATSTYNGKLTSVSASGVLTLDPRPGS